MKKWEKLKIDIEAATDVIQKKEPGDIYKIRTGQVSNEAGSYGQYWAAIDFANGMIRDFSMYTMYPLLRLSYLPSYDLQQLREAYMVFHIPYTEYLGYSGMYELREFCRRFRQCFAEFESKEEFISIYHSFLLYTNKLAAWSYHFFPWEIGSDWKPDSLSVK